MKFTTLALFAGLTTVLAIPTPSPGQKLIHPSVDTSKCLTASSNVDGAPVVIEDCVSGSAGQLWTITNNTFQIFGNKCLDDTNGITANLEEMQIFTCFSGNKNQMWVEEGTFARTIHLFNTNKCLDNRGGLTNNGNPAQLYDCTGGNNQNWNIVDASDSTPPSSEQTISPGKSAALCLVALANKDNAAVALQPCEGTSNQKWNFANGNIQIFGNKCLDVPNGSTKNGQALQIFTCTKGNTNQLFTLTDDRRIAWTNRGECLDLTNGITTPGTAAVQLYKCTDNNDNQVWNLV